MDHISKPIGRVVSDLIMTRVRNDERYQEAPMSKPSLIGMSVRHRERIDREHCSSAEIVKFPVVPINTANMDGAQRAYTMMAHEIRAIAAIYGLEEALAVLDDLRSDISDS